MDSVTIVENTQKKELVMPIEIGDTVKVWVKIVEGGRERLQAFEGVVISIRGGGVSRTFKVRKISNGVGVERTFLIHSPRIDHIEILRRGKARRAKLYFLRDKVGKKARLTERVGIKIPKRKDLLAALEAEKQADAPAEPVAEPEAQAEAPTEETAAE